MKTTTITCLACGHADAVQHNSELDDRAFFASEIFRCSECNARMAFGKLMPRIVVEPYEDARGIRWLRRRYQDPKTREDLFVVDIDPQYAAMDAKNALSLVIP